MAFVFDLNKDPASYTENKAETDRNYHPTYLHHSGRDCLTTKQILKMRSCKNKEQRTIIVLGWDPFQVLKLTLCYEQVNHQTSLIDRFPTEEGTLLYLEAHIDRWVAFRAI